MVMRTRESCEKYSTKNWNYHTSYFRTVPAWENTNRRRSGFQEVTMAEAADKMGADAVDVAISKGLDLDGSPIPPA